MQGLAYHIDYTYTFPGGVSVVLIKERFNKLLHIQIWISFLKNSVKTTVIDGFAGKGRKLARIF